MAGIKEKLNEIKAVEDTLTLNKVARFAYTEEAYETNDANGVSDYDVNRQQNIPVANSDILKVNETVLAKGFRSQASSITRMLMNHFLGRISYNLNKLNDNMSGLLSGLSDSLGKPEGIATLDGDGRIPYSQLPESAMEYKGTWDASTNTPTLADGTGDTGDFYLVSVAGTQDLGSGETAFAEGDRVIYDGIVWQKLSGGSVKSVNGNTPDGTGNITLDTFENLNVTNELNLKGTSVEELIKRAVNSIALNNWTAISDTKFGTNAIKSVAYGNGRWIAVGDSGKASYSDDNGDTWTAISDMKFGNYSIRSIAYGSGRWIAVGAAGKASYSDDNGSTWISISSVALGAIFGTNAINSVAYGNGRWIAVGDLGKASYSNDGIEWNSMSDTKFGTNAINSVAYNNGYWIAVGAAGKASYISPLSPSWTAISDMKFGTTIIRSIAYGNGRWIAVGFAGKASYSKFADGSWTAMSEMGFGSNDITTIAYGNGMWVASGYPAEVFYSENNGVTWTVKRESNFVNARFNSVAYGNGRWIAVGNGGHAYFSLCLLENI